MLLVVHGIQMACAVVSKGEEHEVHGARGEALVWCRSVVYNWCVCFMTVSGGESSSGAADDSRMEPSAAFPAAGGEGR